MTDNNTDNHSSTDMDEPGGAVGAPGAHLKILYWNVHGIHSRTAGDKYKDTTFLGLVSHYDVVCLNQYKIV